jgi:signal transduction histidine kinase
MRFMPPRPPHGSRPPLALGFLVAVACLALETLAGLLLAPVSPAHFFGVLYLPGVLLVASLWGLVPGLAMAAASTVVLDLFLIPPAWSLRLSRDEDLLILAVFMALVVLTCALARLARLLYAEVAAREEAALSAELARLLLRAPELDSALPEAARKLALALGLPSASIRQEAITSAKDRVAFPLRGDGVAATLVVPASLSRPVIRRLRDRVVPSLEVLLEAARERARVADILRRSRDELARVAEEQAALRRLATLVAHAAPPAEVFQAVASEMGRVLQTQHTLVARYEPDGTVVCVGSWNFHPDLDVTLPVASRWTVEKGTVTEIVWRTREPGRVERYEGDGRLAQRLITRGIRSSVGCPILVGRSLWGLAIVSSIVPEPLPPRTERCMQDFTELAAAAIANAQGNADLRASRARVVTAADEARRRIERNLHDGTQQRLVSLGLELRGIAASVPPDCDDLRRQVTRTAQALEETVVDLQEISRGLHPAVLAKGGIEKALIVLTRRSRLPVELSMSLSCRLSQQLEVTVYYVVSEALTNAAKHASASCVRVGLGTNDGLVRVSVHDDGAGGADASHGSGLVGLADRVEALGGRFTVISPAGGGTSLVAELPLETLEG